MAISQPTYPVLTNALVTHVGSYTDTQAAALISTHEADTTAVHGIANTSLLATTSSVTSAVSAHEADTTSVHGISDTSKVKGVVVWTSGSVPARPSGFASVEWIGPDDPSANVQDGDTWVPTEAP